MVPLLTHSSLYIHSGASEAIMTKFSINRPRLIEFLMLQPMLANKDLQNSIWLAGSTDTSLSEAMFLKIFVGWHGFERIFHIKPETRGPFN